MQPAQHIAIAADDLANRWAALRQEKPHLRNRDAAEQLMVSEAELINSGVGRGTVQLRRDWPALFDGLPALGRVMALTRNDEAVHERRGTYDKASFQGHIGLILGADIDLRIFLNQWHFAFAVEETGRKRLQRSLQIFDRSGVAIHKIYAEEATDLAAWAQLIASLATDATPTPLEIEDAVEKQPTIGAQVDKPKFLAEWEALQDTHEFFGFLKRHDLQPTTAFRLAEGRFASRLDANSTFALLTGAAAKKVPIMVFVGNPGLIQIHTGPVERIERVGDWLNVLDPDFNLHLREDRIAESWLVHKPTADGVVTSVELFNQTGGRISSFFGKRKPGEPELGAWRGLAESLALPARGLSSGVAR